MALIEIEDIDREFYHQKLDNFLPERIIDIHAHIWLEEFNLPETGPQRTVTWPRRVAAENPLGDLRKTYTLLLPDKQVRPLVFAMPECDLEANNEYVGKITKTEQIPALLLTRPQWSAEQFEQQIVKSGCLGAKVYLNLSESYIPKAEIRVFDFLPHHQLAILDRHSWIVVLHLPRDQRLKDPVNLAQLIEIEKSYKNVKLIVAHVGRAYCNEDVGNAFEILAETNRMLFDISANTNSWVFEQLIKAVGSKRILFGSDLPITRIRMRRICEKGIYVNLVPKGLYGDVSEDKNMREVEGTEANKLTFFLYEEIDAFRIASERTALTPHDIQNVFFSNADRIISTTRNHGDEI